MVDNVIELKKGGMSEARIIKMLQKQNQPVKLSTADMVKLQKAGVSESIVDVMMDPSAAPAASAPAPPADPPPAAAERSVQPAAGPAVDAGAAGQGTPFPPPFGTPATAGPQKRRLAVKAFDFSSVKANVAAMFGGSEVNVGEMIRAMLTARMHQSKNITLLERNKVDDLLKEQDFGATNRADQKKKAKIGKVTTADAILLGDIVVFGRDDTAKNKRRWYGALRQAHSVLPTSRRKRRPWWRSTCGLWTPKPQR